MNELKSESTQLPQSLSKSEGEGVVRVNLINEISDLVRLCDEAGGFPIHKRTDLFEIDTADDEREKLREDLLSGLESIDHNDLLIDLIADWFVAELLLTFPNCVEYYLAAEYNERKDRAEELLKSEVERYLEADRFINELSNKLFSNEDLFSLHAFYQDISYSILSLKNDIRQQLASESTTVTEAFLYAGNRFLRGLHMSELNQARANGFLHREESEKFYFIDYLYYVRRILGLEQMKDKVGVDAYLRIGEFNRAIDTSGRSDHSELPPMVVGETQNLTVEFILYEGWWPYDVNREMIFFIHSSSPGGCLQIEVTALSNSNTLVIDMVDTHSELENKGRQGSSDQPFNQIILNKYRYFGAAELKIKAINPTEEAVNIVVTVVNGSGVPVMTKQIEGVTVLESSY